MTKHPPTTERLYNLIANEEDARACKDIPDQACREVPRNFILVLLSLVLTKLGDLLINPKTVLAWIMGSVGAPAAMIAWLVPIRESGSMIPQLMIGAWIRRHSRRAGFWVLGSLLQAAAVIGMAATVWLLEGIIAGYALLSLLILFSLSRGLCSVAMKDVQGKTIPKQRRGRLTGLASTLAGIGTVFIAASFLLGNEEPGKTFHTLLLIGAASLWLMAALLFSRIDEYPGETDGGGNAFKRALHSLSLLKEDPVLLHFIISRALLLGSALAAPFLVVLAQQAYSHASLLGTFILASGLASSLSASFWGYMADRSSRQVMILGGAIAAAICLATGTAALLLTITSGLFWLTPLAYFVLGVAHSGVRIGRKTYIVDIASGNRRTDYVAVSNTLIGVLLLVTGAISAVAAMVSVEAVILLLGISGLVGTWMAWRMPEAE